MRILNSIINSLRPASAKPPRPGMIFKPREQDTWRDYPADGLTPPRLVAILKQADAGDLAAQMALYEQMEEKDAHLFSVANTRRLALTGLPWEIVSAAELPGWRSGAGADTDRRLADDAAAYCDAALRNLDGFEESLAHLSLALGRNIAVTELVWEAAAKGPRLACLIPVDFARLTLGPIDDVRLFTADNQRDGIPLPPDKFIVHTPHAASGHPSRGGLLRVTAMAYIAKHFAIKDWLIFAEIFGMPVRIARYAPNATPEEKNELLKMLQQLGAEAAAIFSKAVDIEIKHPRLPGETNLYESICLYFDREVSKAWLGQTLTTDTVQVRSSLAAAQVHERVRKDLRDDDLRKEARTLRRDLLAPLTRLQFGPSAPIPHFRRIPDHGQDPERLARILAIAVNQLGARVPARWAHAALGLPEAVAGEATLEAREAGD